MKIAVTPLTLHRDQRGWLVENEVAKARKNMKHFLVSTSRPGVVRGQHYHKRKREWFMVIQGEGRIFFEDIARGETFFIDVFGKTPQMVEIPPLIAHAIINTGKKKMIMIGVINEPFDKSDPDTYPFTVVR